MGDVGEWRSIGPSSIGPRATGVLFSIAIEPTNPNWIYVASPFCGVWKTEDGTNSWWPIADTLPSLAVAALAVDPSVPGRVYAALAGPLVYRSDDGGANWGAIGVPPDALPAVTDLLVDPTDSAVLYLRGASAIFRSGDGGTSWQIARSGSATALVLDVTQAGVLYAGLPAEGVVRTWDGGVSGDAGWANLTPALSVDGVDDIRVALTRADQSSIYARFRGAGGSAVFRSSDRGQSWTLQSSLPYYSEVLAADDGDPAVVYLAGVGFSRSDDGGVTWQNKPGTHHDHHVFAADPTNSATVYAGCDGGLFRSASRGDGWDFVSTGLENVLFYDIAVSVTEPNVVIGGTQDNGTPLYDGSSLEWSGIWGDDGATVGIDPTNGDVMYAMNQYPSSLVRSTDHGASFHNIAQGLPEGAVCMNFRYQVHPKSPNILLACCSSLWWTTEPGTPWAELFNPSDGSSVAVSAIEGRLDTYYAGTNGGRLYAGPSGQNWQLAFEHPSASSFADVIVDPDDPSVLYAAFAGTDSGRIYRLRGEPGGSLTGTDMSGGLPSGLRVRALALDAINAFTIYAGTDQGVYAGRDEDAVAWSSYSRGMPHADVRALRVHPTTGVLRAGTFGRGAWEVDTAAPIGSLIETVGRITFLRAHDVGTGFGSDPNFLDAEVVLLLDSEPRRAFGFKLRADDEETARQDMLAILRAAFVTNRPVRIDYIRTGPRVGEIIRVANP